MSLLLHCKQNRKLRHRINEDNMHTAFLKQTESLDRCLGGKSDYKADLHGIGNQVDITGISRKRKINVIRGCYWSNILS